MHYVPKHVAFPKTSYRSRGLVLAVLALAFVAYIQMGGVTD